MAFFRKLKTGLTKTKDNLFGKIDYALKGFTHVDEDLYEELEEILISADVGVETSMEMIERLREKVRSEKIKAPSDAYLALKSIMRDLLLEHPYVERDEGQKLHIVLITGVNGSGKTTSIGKIANLLRLQNKHVIVAAADTFRAAAIDQLKIWTERANVDMISHKEGSDPAAVVYDALTAAKARQADVLLCDTAGRLHNKKNLMMELNKIYRVLKKDQQDAKVETLLVIDATTGQNAVAQAETFAQSAPVDGIILTKLDGTAKGGIIFSILSKLQIPVKYVCVGEKIDDLEEFDAAMFVEAMFDENGSKHADYE